MKYLYKILRLFFCPHKWNKTVNKGPVTDGVIKVGNYYDKECAYCHAIREFRT